MMNDDVFDFKWVVFCGFSLASSLYRIITNRYPETSPPRMTFPIIFTFLLLYQILPSSSSSHQPVNEFDKIRNTLYFIDKSQLLDAFFCSENHHFVTCPPKFGKTSILDMIDLFAQVEVDSDYKAVDFAEETHAHKVFKNLLISDYPGTVGTHMARHPVIHLKLSDFPYDELSPATMLAFLNDRLRNTVERYEWIFNLPEEKLNYRYDKYAADLGLDAIQFMKKVLKRKLEVNDIYTSLEKLSQILYRIFYQDVIILVDDYDHAFTKTLLNSVSEFNNTVAKMMSAYNMLNVMLAHGVKHLRFTKALLCGVNNAPFEMINPLVSSYVRSCRFLDDHYFTPYFGFTERDMTTIYYRSNCTSEERQNVETYFASYKTQLKSNSIYNPNSILEYFTRRPSSSIKLDNILKGHLIPNEISPLIQRYLNVSLFRHEMIQLMNNIATKYHVDGFSKMHLDRYVRLMNLNRFKDDSNINTNVLLTFLYDQGYLSYDSSDQYVLPNLEVRHLLESTLTYHYLDEKHLPLKKIGEYLYKMLANVHNPPTPSSYSDRLETTLQSIYQNLFADEYDPPTMLEKYYLIYTGLRLYNTTEHPLNRLSMPIVVSKDYMTYIPSHIEYEIPCSPTTYNTSTSSSNSSIVVVKGVIQITCQRGEQIEPEIKAIFTPHHDDDDDDPACALRVFKIFINRTRNVTLEMSC
ncbi:uncharacterized protein LOC135845774 [Planococcus citri]|uniref:uncharacterized protein LOC135845774 n=1 Tax=Planococcus citri TaxID=170843 RepID=UPI0031F81CE6